MNLSSLSTILAAQQWCSLDVSNSIDHYSLALTHNCAQQTLTTMTVSAATINARYEFKHDEIWTEDSNDGNADDGIGEDVTQPQPEEKEEGAATDSWLPQVGRTKSGAKESSAQLLRRTSVLRWLRSASCSSSIYDATF